jgi:uracil phosphoribosyltransferase
MNNEKKEKPSTEFGLNVQISNHPVLSHKITLLRSSSTIPSAFRAILREITYHLGYEATSNLKTKQVAISVPVDHTHVDHTGQKLADRIALIPIMRSGLGMTDSFLELLPNAGVHHIGIYKKRGQAMPVQYYNRLPPVCDCDVAFLLDPVIGTASTVKSVVGMLKKVGFVFRRMSSLLLCTANCCPYDSFKVGSANYSCSLCHCI